MVELGDIYRWGSGMDGRMGVMAMGCRCCAWEMGPTITSSG